MRCFLIYIPCQVQIVLSNICLNFAYLTICWHHQSLLCRDVVGVLLGRWEALRLCILCLWVCGGVCYIFSSAGQLWFMSFNYLHFTLWRFDFTAFQILEICIDLHGTAWNYSWFTTQLFQAHRSPQRFSSDLSFKKMTPLLHLQY